MKVFKPLLLVVLISTFTLTACKDEQGKAVKPAAPDQALQDLAVQWSTPMQSQADLDKIQERYKALDANRLNAFIKASAAHKISQGEPKIAVELQAKAQLETNKKSVEKYGKGYNQLTSAELDGVMDELAEAGKYAALNDVSNSLAADPEYRNARVASTCSPWAATWTCSNPYRANYDRGPQSVSNNLSSQAICPTAYGLTVKNGQSDCDYFIWWNYTVPSIGIYFTGGVWAQTAEISNMLRDMRCGIDDSQSDCVSTPNTCQFRRAILLGAHRTNLFGGGIVTVARSIRLNPH